MSLDGIDDVSALPGNAAPAGVDLGTAIVLPPGGQVFYVRGNGTSTTLYSFDPPGLQDRLIASVQKALSYTVANRGDTVVVLPGHTESIAAADGWSNLTAGTKVLGLGTGVNRPTITWSATASSMLLNDANVTLDNLRLLLAPAAGSVTVTAAITVSAVGVTIRRCYIEVGTTAARFTTTGITVASGADDFQFTSNQVFGSLTATPTDVLLVNAAVARPKILSNDIQAATSAAAHGVVAFTTAAATNIQLKGNFMANYVAASTVACQVVTGVTGVTSDNYAQTVNASAATAITIAAAGPSSFNNFICQAGKQPIAATTGAGASS